VAQARGQHSLKAIDTNILVRLVARDDEEQLQLARAFVAEGPVFISLICLLESIWVLESRFELERAQLYEALMAIFDVQNIAVELDEMAGWALGRWKAGADMADMLLLVAARDQDSFATFDQRLARKAGRGTPVKVETLR
jgi:predicted nucleic-acid-binding protein